MTKVKTPKKYFYDYPTNRELYKHLHYCDLTRLSKTTGYTHGHLSAIFRGKRKIPHGVLEEFLKLCPEAAKICKTVPVIPIKKSNT
jgi:hypothetical protein